MTSGLSDQAALQESQYLFPYHYLSLYSVEHRDLLHLHYLEELRLVRAWLEAMGARSVLDVGCGDGRLCYELKDRFRVVGIDMSERAIAFARAFNPDVEFLVGSEWSRDETFDAVTLVEVLEHLPKESIPVMRRSLRRAMRCDSNLIVAVPHLGMPVSRKHFQHFSFESLAAAMRPEFEPVEQVGYFVGGYRWRWFSRLTKVAVATGCLGYTNVVARMLRDQVARYFHARRLNYGTSHLSIIVRFKVAEPR